MSSDTVLTAAHCKPDPPCSHNPDCDLLVVAEFMVSTSKSTSI